MKCSTYSRPTGVISDSLCASSCSLHPSCHLVTPSLKELTNVSHLMSHISLGHTGAIWVTANRFFKIFQSFKTFSIFFFKGKYCASLYTDVLFWKIIWSLKYQVSLDQHISNIDKHIYGKGFCFSWIARSGFAVCQTEILNLFTLHPRILGSEIRDHDNTMTIIFIVRRRSNRAWMTIF